MRARCPSLCWFLFAALLASAHLAPAGPQAPKSSAPLSIEDVLKLSQSGLSEELIITTIKKNGKAFDLSADEILELKKAGISDNVLKYLVDPSQPYTPPPPPAPTAPDPAAPAPPKAPEKEYPADPNASRVPPEPGLYFFPVDAPARIDIKMLLGEKQGPGLGKILLKKGKVIAYLVGTASRARIKSLAPVFYLRLPEGVKGIEEVVLVCLDQKRDRREIDMGPPGPKPEFKAEAMRQYDSLEVGPRLFRIATGRLAAGEYLFFLTGSAEMAKGEYGKGYDFGVESPAAKRK